MRTGRQPDSEDLPLVIADEEIRPFARPYSGRRESCLPAGGVDDEGRNGITEVCPAAPIISIPRMTGVRK